MRIRSLSTHSKYSWLGQLMCGHKGALVLGVYTRLAGMPLVCRREIWRNRRKIIQRRRVAVSALSLE